MSDNEKKINTATPVRTGQPFKLSQETMQKIKIQRKFEIFVEEFDETKEPGQWKPVRIDPALGGNGSNPVITVSSQQDLIEKQNFYKSVGQRFKIIREIDPPTPEDIFRLACEQGLVDAKQDNLAQPASNSIPENTDLGFSTDMRVKPNYPAEPPRSCPEPAKPAAKVKIITIGDMQIKYDGDKVYQKQWCRLTPAEESNFRVVHDSTNKIVQLSGKHIEAKRWVLIEEQDDDAETSEELLNG